MCPTASLPGFAIGTELAQGQPEDIGEEFVELLGEGRGRKTGGWMKLLQIRGTTTKTWNARGCQVFSAGLQWQYQGNLSLLSSSSVELGKAVVRNETDIGRHPSALESTGVLPGTGRILASKGDQAGGILPLLEAPEMAPG